MNILHVVYFSSPSENTHRFVEKLHASATRIPFDGTQHVRVNHDYVLICPTYSGGGKSAQGTLDTRCVVPKQVIQFLNDEHDRALCRAVIGCGNTIFGDSFAISGAIIAQKLGIPMAYQFELSGTREDVARVQKLIDGEVELPACAVPSATHSHENER